MQQTTVYYQIECKPQQILTETVEWSRFTPNVSYGDKDLALHTISHLRPEAFKGYSFRIVKVTLTREIVSRKKIE